MSCFICHIYVTPAHAYISHKHRKLREPLRVNEVIQMELSDNMMAGIEVSLVQISSMRSRITA